MQLERRVEGVVVLSTLASSVGLFMAPFFLSFHGKEGLRLLAAFDLGNSPVANSQAYSVVMRYGRAGTLSIWQGTRRILATPLIWANLFDIALNLSHFVLPELITLILDSLGSANSVLSMIALGIFGELRFPDWNAMITAIALRMAFGWGLRPVLVWLGGLTGMERTVVSIGAATPIGVMVLIHASLKELDVRFSAATLSLSIVVGMFLTLLLLNIYLSSHIYSTFCPSQEATMGASTEGAVNSGVRCI